MKPSAFKYSAILTTSKSVIKYNLTSFRDREGVQAIFGRPVTRLRLEPASACSESPPCLRDPVGKGSVAELLDRIESAELKIEEFAVDGLVLDGLKDHEIVVKKLSWVDELLMAMDCQRHVVRHALEASSACCNNSTSLTLMIRK